jgi:hypothetical protein
MTLFLDTGKIKAIGYQWQHFSPEKVRAGGIVGKSQQLSGFGLFFFTHLDIL